ncbi:YetF domain-containing protein [Blastococcus aurantiacus]|uniref:YetF domain-containing protein n=1 Tax=Blastococcus aurantiacus TaxID=1550231 RepID=UPI000B80672F|nr:YetF domain-containing protein [Blastococcus aurantiacus]
MTEAVSLREQRVTEDEVRQAVRATGSGDLGSIAAVVLESDGSLSVISRSNAGDLKALDGVRSPT